MKKLASLLLSGALALGLLAGCGGTPGTADTAETLLSIFAVRISSVIS